MIAIIAAMNEEVEALTALMTNLNNKDIKGINFYTGNLNNKEVVVCQSGVGKVNAAISTTILIDSFEIEYIINIGSAGSLRNDIRCGSVVIPEVVAHHDCNVPGWPKGFEGGKRTYYPDNNLISKAKKIADDKTYFVPLVSGDSFIYLPSQTEKILNDYKDAGCCEMEGASIAQTADFFKVPFIIIRSISDVTIEDGNEMAFEDFLPIAAKNSAVYCEKFVGLE